MKIRFFFPCMEKKAQSWPLNEYGKIGCGGSLSHFRVNVMFLPSIVSGFSIIRFHQENRKSIMQGEKLKEKKKDKKLFHKKKCKFQLHFWCING